MSVFIDGEKAEVIKINAPLPHNIEIYKGSGVICDSPAPTIKIELS